MNPLFGGFHSISTISYTSMLGIFYSLLASMLFGGLYYLSTLLRPLSGVDVFGFRMLLMFPFMLILLFVVLRKRAEFLDFLQRIRRELYLIGVLAFTAMLCGVQMWLFLWAPNSGKAIDVSIGYLLMPITMVLVGKIVYRERLSPLKIGAIVLAFIGVMSSVVASGALSWASALVFLGYPFYFVVRKKYHISHIYSFVCEIALLLPIAFYFVSQIELASILQANPNLYFYLFLLGLLSGVALMSYTLASTLLPFNLLGLLGYVEPCVMMLVSLIIGERLDPNAYTLMICLSLAIMCLIFDGILIIRKKKRQEQQNA